jgi:hypothetical protein
LNSEEYPLILETSLLTLFFSFLISVSSIPAAVAKTGIQAGGNIPQAALDPYTTFLS